MEGGDRRERGGRGGKMIKMYVVTLDLLQSYTVYYYWRSCDIIVCVQCSPESRAFDALSANLSAEASTQSSKKVSSASFMGERERDRAREEDPVTSTLHSRVCVCL